MYADVIDRISQAAACYVLLRALLRGSSVGTSIWISDFVGESAGRKATVFALQKVAGGAAGAVGMVGCKYIVSSAGTYQTTTPTVILSTPLPPPSLPRKGSRGTPTIGVSLESVAQATSTVYADVSTHTIST